MCNDWPGVVRAVTGLSVVCAMTGLIWLNVVRAAIGPV